MGAKRLYSTYRNDLSKVMKDSEQGRYLVEIGYAEDLDECVKVDVSKALPVLRSGVIKLIESFEHDPKLTMKRVAKSS